jgi:transcriptional regulator with XRE-family HTH domain
VRQRERVSKTPPADSDRPDVQFGRSLADLRKRAGLSQSQAAKNSGVHQTDISRMERGRTRITAARVKALLAAYAAGENRAGLTPEQIGQLVEEARQLAERFADKRVHLQYGSPIHTARRTAAAEASATLVRSYQPLMILGTLQTRDYASAVFGAGEDLAPDELERVVRERMKRWGSLTDNPNRQWVLIQTEWALRWPIRSYALQAAQVAQLLTASELPNVRLGVIPLDTVAPYPVTVTGFHLYDDTELVVGTDLGVAQTNRPAHIADYIARFEALESLAVFDEPARELLRGIARNYQARAEA